tara:strand:+ start:4711 stop:4938 length:228 start_codon:yes stop_codon:yes gene_type:complete
LKLLFEDEFEEYLFGRWAEYCEQMLDRPNRLTVFEFEEEHDEAILIFFKASKVNLAKSQSDYQEWLSKITQITLH